MYSKVFIPYRGYFSSPFSRWQGSLQSEHPVELVAATAKNGLRQKSLTPKCLIISFSEKP
jgi:acetyl-CoA acetyltransferase